MDDNFLFSLPDELLLYILQFLDYPSCLLFFSTCQKLRALGNDEFWKYQAKSRFDVTAQLSKNKTYKDKYIELAAKRKEYGPLSEKYVPLSTIARNFSNVHILYRKYFINKFTNNEINITMCHFAQKGNICGVKLMLDKGANNHYLAAEWAAKGGHMDIVKLMLDKGVSLYMMLDKGISIEDLAFNVHFSVHHYNEAMSCAARRGNMKIVQLILDKGENNYNYNYDWAMQQAANEGHIAIVRLMLEKGANEYNSTMSCAAEGGHIDIVQLMLDKGANNYNDVMLYAARLHAVLEGNIDIVQLMLDKGADDYNYVMSYAAREGIIDIVQLMLNKGADDYNEAMSEAAEGGYMEIVDFILDKGGRYNRAMAYAAGDRCMEIVQLLLSKGATNYIEAMKEAVERAVKYAARCSSEIDVIQPLMAYAAEGGHIAIVKLLQTKI